MVCGFQSHFVKFCFHTEHLGNRWKRLTMSQMDESHVYCRQHNAKIHLSMLICTFKHNKYAWTNISSTDSLQQVKDYFRVCTWPLKKFKTIDRFHRLVVYRRDSCLECSNRATHNYGLCHTVPVKYCMREKQLLSSLSLTLRDNEWRGMHVP